LVFQPLLSVVGLALDLVGAVALVIGLFGHSIPLYTGFRRAPTEVAHDGAFGIVGATYLVSGFLLQSLQYVGVSLDCSREATRVAGVVTLLGGSIAAWLAYGTAYLLILDHEKRYCREQLEEPVSLKRVAKGLRFWNQEHAAPDT
jgi:hypothetical protein